MEGRFRRPTPRWCTDVAIRLLKIACREEDRELLSAEEGRQLLAAAELLDRYGQRLRGGPASSLVESIRRRRCGAA